MSLPLADQKLGSRSATDSTSHKFMLKGRQSGGIHRGHAWVFRAESYDTMLAWYEDIKNLTEKTGAERNEFIRRSHARSVSAGSHKAGSISSDGMEEDEADEVPYSATASHAEVRPPQEKLPQRPNPGGRFPSALNVNNRDSQAVPSSPSSSDERDIVAAAGALSGSDFPFSNQMQQMQAVDDETSGARGELGGDSTAPFHKNVYSPIANHQDYNGLLVQQGPNPVATGGGAPRALPYQVGRHDSKYGDWMGPAAGAVGGGAVGAAGIEAYQHQQDQRNAAVQEEQPGLQVVEASSEPPVPTSGTAQKSVEQPAEGAIFATIPYVPGTASQHASTANPTISTATAVSTSHTSDPAAPIKDLADRPPLASHVSVNTMSDLHVPGEFL
jgi:hypothetical protein